MTTESKNIQPENGQNASQNDYINFYSTFDLGCSAALICAGFELASLDKTNPRKVQFIFRRNASIDNAVGDYWDDRLEIKARSFFDNIKMLKNRIYSE
ncbi:MAG: DUF5659 domain-containing protein [Patescibacteria group bacterium]